MTSDATSFISDDGGRLSLNQPPNVPVIVIFGAFPRSFNPDVTHALTLDKLSVPYHVVLTQGRNVLITLERFGARQVEAPLQSDIACSITLPDGTEGGWSQMDMTSRTVTGNFDDVQFASVTPYQEPDWVIYASVIGIT